MIRSTRARLDQKGCALVPLDVIGAGKPPSSRTVRSRRCVATSLANAAHCAAACDTWV